MPAPHPIERFAASMALLLSLFGAIWLPVLLPHYVVELALRGREVVRREVVLTPRPDGSMVLGRHVYTFTAEGTEYKGSSHLFASAVRTNRITGAESAELVHRADAPWHHRLEPVPSVVGVPVPLLFPRVLLAVAIAAAVGWAIASREHFRAILLWTSARGRTIRDEAMMILLNTVVAVLMPISVAALVGACIAPSGVYWIYTDMVLVLFVVGVMAGAGWFLAGRECTRLERIPIQLTAEEQACRENV